MVSKISLIANSGLQIYRTEMPAIEEESAKMYFWETFDADELKHKVELARYFQNEDKYVSRQDLENSSVAGINSETRKPWTWDEISQKGLSIRVFSENEIIKCSWRDFSKTRQNEGSTFLDRLLNVWLPIPYFEYNNLMRFKIGPYNWARMKIIPDSSNNKKWNVVIAFDTKTGYTSSPSYDNAYEETPFFASDFENQKTFGFCADESKLFQFCSPDGKSEWVDKYIMKLFEGHSKFAEIKRHFKFTYLAYYVYLLSVLKENMQFPDVVLYKDKDKPRQNVTLVVDVGNSKTTAILYEKDLAPTPMLRLNNFSDPSKYSDEPFDMHIAFQKADFGDILTNSKQFGYPSFIRLGEEAKYLIYNSKNNNITSEVLTTCSSPKRYLWDDKKRKYEWEYISLKDNFSANGRNNNPIWINGVSEQLNGDGTINYGVNQGYSNEKCYSRKSLMSFVFLEILSQARMQINSFEYRDKIGNSSMPRKISKIIVTCPTAMSRQEQIALREAAENAFVLQYRFINGLSNVAVDKNEILSEIEILPKVKNLKKTDERTEWLYDEPTCSQFVFLAAEISKRYKNRCEEYFDIYGKVRNDLPGYNKKSLTIASLDIGAGTTDLMISAYKYGESEKPQQGMASIQNRSNLIPVPLFWESFYQAGDDMLKAFVQRIVIEGPNSMVENKLRGMNSNRVEELITNFFGQDSANMAFRDREIRKDFNLQISVPIAQKYMEESRKQTKSTTFTWTDFFTPTNKPSKHLLDEFYNHFGFRIEDQSWKFDSAIVDKIIEDSFDELLKKASAIMTAYSCDIVLMSGRPTTLKQIEKILLRYYPVSPNRLKILNDYRVGTWYPYQDGNGYFTSQKSIVAVGALIGYQASCQGQFDGMSLDLHEMIEKVLPTTDYFGNADAYTGNISYLLTPEENTRKVIVNLPYRIVCQQIKSEYYPYRDFYTFDFDIYGIEYAMKKKHGDLTDEELKKAVEKEIERIRSNFPLTIDIERGDFSTDKETITVSAIADKNGDDLPLKYFSLQINSLGENDDFWMDSGAFKTSIKTR